jgi:hypothetical protein
VFGTTRYVPYFFKKTKLGLASVIQPDEFYGLFFTENLFLINRVPDPHVFGPSGSTRQKFSYLAGMSPYISLKIKKRHYEHHMIEAHK